MNFEATKRLLDVVSSYIPIENLTVKSDGNIDWRGRAYIADFVEIIKEGSNQISFQVTEKEIIVFFFTDHIHFEDYSSASENNDPNYVERAMEFLKKLFTFPVELRYTTKGDKIIWSESYFVLPNAEKESCAGITLCLAGFKNIFKKRVKHMEVKSFDNHIGNFVSNSL